jgi:ATP-dependent DNA helicase RecQ
MPISKEELHATLKAVFGYDSFRPLQAEIISDALAGRDVFALLPTGGGKSLCFQLPALLRPGLTIVVSPLIALMKDQVDSLHASGIAATWLNSTLDGGESRSRLRALFRGDFRMLYVAPERLLLPGFLEKAQKWNVTQIAIDEAHCVSEWGHDFRPEYRQLAQLRGVWPAVPIMALTATATDRVQTDVVTHLQLREPRSYVASFNRPNLFYRVVARDKAYEQTRAFIQARSQESGIIYCQSRKTTESVAERLEADGIRAAPYHAGLDPAVRARNQDLFLHDDVRVICATIAFGMGINKPNVRYVVHYDLPKNIEGYYQETGRAGRDGLPGECLLLFNASDVVKQASFIAEKSDPREQRIAREQLQQMVHFAESRSCRRRELLAYFGESFENENCAGCDNCLTPRETFDGTIAAQKFLSCIYRVRQKSGFNFGLKHIVDVLTGADTQPIRKWRHEEISAYAIGRDTPRETWLAVGRELIRLGFIHQSPERFSTIELTGEGLAALKERRPITLTKTSTRAEKKRPRVRQGEIPCDEALFEHLRALRRRIAQERSVPAYVIFSDVTLRHMARKYPKESSELRAIPGIGQQKLQDFAAPFLAAIRAFLDQKSEVAPRRAQLHPAEETLI